MALPNLAVRDQGAALRTALAELVDTLIAWLRGVGDCLSCRDARRGADRSSRSLTLRVSSRSLPPGGTSGSGEVAPLPHTVGQAEHSRPAPAAPGQAATRSPSASLARPAPPSSPWGGRRHTERLRCGPGEWGVQAYCAARARP